MTSTPKVTLLQLPLSLDTSSVEREVLYWRETWKTLNRNLVKNLPTHWWETEKENRETNENILAP